jgi:hypothetical protein
MPIGQISPSGSRDNGVRGGYPIKTIFEPEPFVSAEEAARFLAISRRHLLLLARKGIGGAYALGTGTKRRIWVFRLSELAAAIATKEQPAPATGHANGYTILSGSPR